jgi:low affinity Fe/Cu permease
MRSMKSAARCAWLAAAKIARLSLGRGAPRGRIARQTGDITVSPRTVSRYRSVAAMGLLVLKTPVRTPQANAFCEPLIGPMRRKCLDWVPRISRSPVATRSVYRPRESFWSVLNGGGMTTRGGETVLEGVSTRVSEWTGSSRAFLLSIALVMAWALTGPLFHYSDAWQLVINSVTNIVTFVMVFLIQRAQNKSSMSTHLKLDELIAATQGASNRTIAIDDLSEEELLRLHARYRELANRNQGSEPTSITATTR